MPCPTRRRKSGGVPKWREGASYRPNVSHARGKSAPILAVLAAIDAGQQPDRGDLRDAVRQFLAELSRRAPGRSVEVRVPPYGAVQCVAGPRHTRGTPPNVVETDPLTFVELASGRLDWFEAVNSGRVLASGARADLSTVFPLAVQSD
jgi:Bacterial SCP ortholog